MENLEKQSLCAQRMVYNHLQTECNTLHEFKIEKELVVSARSARSRYHAALEATKDKGNERQDVQKEKKAD